GERLDRADGEDRKDVAEPWVGGGAHGHHAERRGHEEAPVGAIAQPAAPAGEQEDGYGEEGDGEPDDQAVVAAGGQILGPDDVVHAEHRSCGRQGHARDEQRGAEPPQPRRRRGGEEASPMPAPRVSGIRMMAPMPRRTATPEAAKIPEYAQSATAPPIAGPRSSPTISHPWSWA